MPTQIPYDRSKAAAYAEKWAFSRNPRYISFDGMGGRLYQLRLPVPLRGHGRHEFHPRYRLVLQFRLRPRRRLERRALSLPLSDGQPLGRPYGRAAALEELERGDLIQLGDASDKWYHSLFVTEVTGDDILVSTHTFDAYRRPLSSYVYAQARGIHIEGARRW